MRDNRYWQLVRRLFWDQRWLLAIIALGLFFRVGVGLYLSGREFVSDEAEYFGAALTVAQGRGFSFYDTAPWLRPPVYILFSALPLSWWGPQVLPLLALQHAISIATVVVFYHLGRLMFDKRVGLFAAAACAAYLPLAVFANLVLAETLFLALFSLGVLLLVLSLTAERRLLLVAAAGGLLGVATLTKGLVYAFIPFAAVWLFMSGRGYRRRSGIAGVFLISYVLVMVPWTARNYAAYRAFIPVDTTGAVNLWLAAHRGPSGEVYAALSQIEGIPERQEAAYRAGFQEIVDRPLDWLAKGSKEAADLWRINYSGDERFVDGFAHGLVPGPYLISLLVLDDSAYILLMCLALFGLVLSKNNAAKGLVLLWIGFSCLLAVLFFAIGRFRIPLLPFLFPYAGYAVFEAIPRIRRRLVPASRTVLAGALCGLFLLLVLPTYPLGLTGLGVQKWLAQSHLGSGDELLREGLVDQARAEYERADQELPETKVALARLEVIQGNLEGAEGLLVDGRKYFGTKVMLGEIYRQRGEAETARRLFTEGVVNAQNPTQWAWERTSPPPTDKIDIGSGLDLGYVQDMHLGERESEVTYRWTGPKSLLRFPQVSQAQGYRLLLRVRGWRPEGAPAPAVHIWANGKSVATIIASSRWDVYRLEVPAKAVAPGEDLVVEMKAEVFTPGFKDKRILGVMIDWAELEPLGLVETGRVTGSPGEGAS